uniref:RdRp n=1 Tax=Wuhan house centipede virus 8 TaxID=1923712 RepID=A0A1L3KLU0_9VIRU|nr:RdRp [Wuhan house centipede virus 8]
MMKYIGIVPGFAQRTYAHILQTPFLPSYKTNKWRSPVTQSLIKHDLCEFGNKNKMPDNMLLRHAINLAFNDFALPEKVKMIHLNDIFQQDLDIWNKSPGLPWRDIGYKTKGDIKKDPEAIKKVRWFWHRIKDGEDIRPPDCLAYVRSHVVDIGEYKVRAVWGYPATVTFGEAMFALPLIRGYQKYRRPIAYGYETALGGARKITNRFSPYQNFVGLDFRKFDKTVPVWLIEVAFDILASNIDFVRYDDYGIADARRNVKMYEYIKHYFINTTIRTANGLRFKKSSGIASGSYFTQLIGSIVNYILCQWMCLELQGVFCKDILVQGDDSLFATSTVFDLQKAFKMMESIGMEINREKSQVTTELGTMKFLGYQLGFGVPRKPRDEWMTALLFPETPDITMAHLQSRALGLYYANMYVDRQFAELCKEIIQKCPFDLVIPRDFERKLKYIGLSLEVLKTGRLPTEMEFARLMI